MWLLTVPFSKSNKTRGDLLYNKDLHSCLALRPNLKSKLFFSYGVEKQSGFDSGEKKKKKLFYLAVQEPHLNLFLYENAQCPVKNIILNLSRAL